MHGDGHSNCRPVDIALVDVLILPPFLALVSSNITQVAFVRTSHRREVRLVARLACPSALCLVKGLVRNGGQRRVSVVQSALDHPAEPGRGLFRQIAIVRLDSPQ